MLSCCNMRFIGNVLKASFDHKLSEGRHRTNFHPRTETKKTIGKQVDCLGGRHSHQRQKNVILTNYLHHMGSTTLSMEKDAGDTRAVFQHFPGGLKDVMRQKTVCWCRCASLDGFRRIRHLQYLIPAVLMGQGTAVPWSGQYPCLTPTLLYNWGCFLPCNAFESLLL